MSWLVIVILILVCMGGLPTWGIHNYGYYPSGILGVVLVVVVILLLMGRL
jgi:hypothetical protein